MHYKERFERIATTANFKANQNRNSETVSEIVTVTKDGATLIYTDSEQQAVTFVGIGNPERPQNLATLQLEGEPTSVDVISNERAVVAVDTSDSHTDPSGRLTVVDISSPVEPEVARRVNLGGQPDAVAVSPDGHYTAVAVENERDEQLCVGGSMNGKKVAAADDAAANRCRQSGGTVGGLPQTDLGNPPGHLAVVDNRELSVRRVEMTGLAGFAADDPEPEYVDVNTANQAVVTLQENNHLAIVDLAQASLVQDFSAGHVTLSNVDAKSDGRIVQDDRIADVPREPDAVTWLGPGPSGKPLLATANEGDLRGGARGFTLFDMQGNVVYDSGNSYERLAIRHGHFPESEAGGAGTEPEGISYGRYGGNEYLFVSSENGSFVAVYELWGTQPRFVQVLPGPLAPEGMLPIPERELLVVSGEADNPEFGVRSTMMLYQLQEGAPSYPQVVSAKGRNGRPMGWSALSGLSVKQGAGRNLLAVSDSYYDRTHLFTIDASQRPAVITAARSLGSGNYDAEGIATAPDGSRWIASEGEPGSRPNELLKVGGDGKVAQSVGLPERVVACRAESKRTASLDNGFEGVAVEPNGQGYRLLAAQQLPWHYTSQGCESLDDTAKTTRIWRYAPATGAWDHIVYELADVPEHASWVGLSEIERAPDGSYVLIERDGLTGEFSQLKQLVRVTPEAMEDGRITREEKQSVDLLHRMRATNGWISDKPEGLAIASDGQVYLVTDNDGVDGWSGETQFLDLGTHSQLFPAAR